MRRLWILLVVVLICAGIAEAKPLAKVYGVTLTMEAVPPSPGNTRTPSMGLIFQGAWKVRHGPAEAIQVRLIVNGKVMRNQYLAGGATEMAYALEGLAPGTVVTFAARAVWDNSGRRAQRWRAATVVVPLRW